MRSNCQEGTGDLFTLVHPILIFEVLLAGRSRAEDLNLGMRGRHQPTPLSLLRNGCH
jgi:hypothetical protein